MSAVIRSFDMNPANSLDSFSLLILIQMMRSPCCTPCGLQQGIVWTSPIMGLIQEDVEGLLIDSSLWELNLAETQSVTQGAYALFSVVIYKIQITNSYLPLSASFLWHTQWRCSTPQQSYGLGHKRTNNRSHHQSHLWWRGHDRWIAMTACQTARCSSACCHLNCWEVTRWSLFWDHFFFPTLKILISVEEKLTWYMNICCCFGCTAVWQ